MYEELGRRLGQTGLVPAGPAIAYYEDAPDGGGVLVHATLPVNADPAGGHDFEIIDLPGISQAATIIHRGSMDNVMATIQTLARWIENSSHRTTGTPARCTSSARKSGIRGSPNSRSPSPPADLADRLPARQAIGPAGRFSSREWCCSRAFSYATKACLAIMTGYETVAIWLKPTPPGKSCSTTISSLRALRGSLRVDSAGRGTRMTRALPVQPAAGPSRDVEVVALAEQPGQDDVQGIHRLGPVAAPVVLQDD